MPGNTPGTTSSVLVSGSPSDNEADIRWIEDDKGSLLPKMRWPLSWGYAGGNDGGKRRGRGGGIAGMNMEGSRCSRVNGRGWRCGRQTLFGYSLCGHHSGKGRLKSTASIRGSAWIGVEAASRKVSQKPRIGGAGPSLAKSFADIDDEIEEENVKVDSAEVGKKKARSMSSFIGKGPDYADD